MIEKLQEALKTDEDYHYSWQANIAMAFVDEYNRSEKKYKNKAEIHKIANDAAKHFIHVLCENIIEDKL